VSSGPHDQAGRGGPPTGEGGPHVFVESLDRPELTPEDDHHLRRVLRTRPGDPITISDGQGRWRPAIFDTAPQPTGAVVEVAEASPLITVGFVVPKGDRPNWVVQKLTELGVDRIQPLSSRRSVVRWEGERGRKHLERLRSVARAAAMQSRQVRLPVIEPMRDVSELLNGGEAVLAQRGGLPPSLTRPAVLVGPEGGWDPAELASATATVDLGPSVLRADTAAVLAGGALALLRAGLACEHSA
jgi:16S rRNA (uracil1498-N3)-methyltransferase